MGMALVREAMGPHWASLTPFSRLVLVHMATTALDKANTVGDEARLYFAGHAPIVLFVAGVGEESAGTRAYESARKRVARAIAELTEAGAIRVARRAVNGRVAVYELTTSSIPLPVDNSTLGGDEAGPKGRVEGDMGVPLRGTWVSH